MTILKDLALAGFQMEKQAGRYDSPGALKNIAGDLVGAVKKHTPTAIAAGIGARIATKKPVEKKASLVDVAKSIASTAKGAGSVAKNLVKQNPVAAKAAAGGAVAGMAAAKMTQTKQAEVKEAAKRTAQGDQDHRHAIMMGSYAGAGLGTYGVIKATDLHESGIAAKKGINAIKSRAAGTSERPSVLSKADRSAVYEKLVAPSAKLSTKNKLLSTATIFSKKNFGRNLAIGLSAGAGLGGYAGHKAYEHLTKKSGIIAAKDPGLAKEEKDDIGPFNASPGAASGVGGGGTGKSSLIAAAKAEMNKPA